MARGRKSQTRVMGPHGFSGSENPYSAKTRVHGKHGFENIIGDLKGALKPRKRTNNKSYSAKDGAIIAGKTGRGGFGAKAIDASGSESSSIASPLTEIARTVTTYSDGDHDYRVALTSTCTDANGSEVVIHWLNPDSTNITEI